MKSRVLVTGASGFIGWNCLWMLLSKGYEVHAVSRQAAPEGVSPEVIWHQLNLLDPGCAAQIIGRVRPERLLHLAWYAVTGSFWEAAENVEWVRVSLDLLRAFAEGGGKRTVAACSCAEYDMTAGECAETTTLLLPQTLYGQSKLAFEKAGQEAARQAGLSAAWGRVFFMYGPRENAARPVAHVVKSLMKGEPAECSEGTQVLDVSHVEDIAGGLVALLESSVQGPVNIGTGNPVTLRTVFETIGAQLGRMELIRFGARQGSSPAYRLWARTVRLNQEVGWTPRFNLASGIADTIEWWRRSPEFAAAGSDRRKTEEAAGLSPRATGSG